MDPSIILRGNYRFLIKFHFHFRVDELYHFLQVWVPQLYGELIEVKVTERGFELVESDTELWDDENAEGDEEGDETGGSELQCDASHSSWEVSFFLSL